MIIRIKNKVENLKYHWIAAKYNFFQRFSQFRKLEKKLNLNKPNLDFLNIHSSQERFVEVMEEDKNLQNVLFSCYFIKKENPQTGEIQGSADFKYIQLWYESVKSLNIDAIIIHDGIDEDFIRKYASDKIKFRRFYSGNHPLIDERWIMFYLFLTKTKIQKAFFTDIGDVVLTKNPFELITDKNQFFIGRDNANKIDSSGWIKNEIQKFQNETKVKLPKSFFLQPLYNVGIVGGNRKVMLFVLSRMMEYLLISDSTTYKEMTIFNIIVHEHFFPYISFNKKEQKIVDTKNDSASSHNYLISGYPLNSAFKGFENNSDAYFIHK